MNPKPKQSGLRLTRDEVLSLPAAAYSSAYAVQCAIYRKFACGVSRATAERIIRDYHASRGSNGK